MSCYSGCTYQLGPTASCKINSSGGDRIEIKRAGNCALTFGASQSSHDWMKCELFANSYKLFVVSAGLCIGCSNGKVHTQKNIFLSGSYCLKKRAISMGPVL